jgi:hypothetical protein
VGILPVQHNSLHFCCPRTSIKLKYHCSTRKPIPINLGGHGDPGVVLPPALLSGYIMALLVYGTSPEQGLPTAAENAVTFLKDADVNSIDIFYVETIQNPAGRRFPGYARIATMNKTGNDVFQNFIVLSKTRKILTIAHEIMHILLSDVHRPGEPDTALFNVTRNDTRSDSTKRIGPYPDAEATGIGSRDTETIRANAETLPS